MGLSMFLKRRRMSAKLAAVQKYCCFRRSSFPTDGATDHHEGVLGSKAANSHEVWSFGYRTDVIAAALLEDSIARS